MIFDSCPACGAEPKFGLRCHPKFSLKVGMAHDLVALYAHDEPTIRALAEKFDTNDIMGIDAWDGERWVDITYSGVVSGRMVAYKDGTISTKSWVGTRADEPKLDERLSRWPWLLQDDN